MSVTEKTGNEIVTVGIENEMRKSYLDYAMSVIVSRALPDARDGLKPVHRRILYSMYENGFDYSKPFRKSARIVGDVMGKYHPHGDRAIYDAMVRMAQNFSMRLPLIASQGNFGSMDGDKAAAMRYTEAKLALSAQNLIDDIDKDTVDFVANYDESTKEPAVLPARFPNLLVNGAGGIAVGMATNIPPHNLGELIDGCCAYIDNPEITSEDLIQYIPGPDFPTGGLILGTGGAKSAYMTGRGSIMMRGRCNIEENKNRESIIITEIPYQVNKASMITQIADMVRAKTLEGISEIRDESDRQGVRVVIEIKRDAQADVVLNHLYKYTQLQTSFGANMIALNHGRPEMMTLVDMIRAFIEFREETIKRRTIYNLDKARNRAHVLVGLAIAVANLDAVITMIKSSKDPAEAREKLMSTLWDASDVEPLVQLIDEPDRKVVDGKYELSETQVRAILDLKLHRLTGLERDKIHNELTELGGEIKYYLEILGNRSLLYSILREELIEVKDKFATPRRTSIELSGDFTQDDEDLIAREDMVVTVTNTGYIKRVLTSTYRAQRRGGKGRSAMNTHDEDYVTNLLIANTHTPLLFFSDAGKVYKLKVYKLPLGTPQSKGRAIVNLLPLAKNERITTIMPLPETVEECAGLTIMFATKTGGVRRNELKEFFNVQSNGKIAMKLDEGDNLVDVKICDDNQDILLAMKGGKCIRFPVTDVRIFASRASTGVRGVKLVKGDEVISMSVLSHFKADAEKRAAYLKMANAIRKMPGDEEGEIEADAEVVNVGSITDEEYKEMAAAEEFILTITENGFGKRSSAYEYRITKRGGSGVANLNLSKNRAVIASMPVDASDDIMLVTDGGKLIRTAVNSIRIAGRNTSGVIVFRLDPKEKIVSVTPTQKEDEEDLEEVENTAATPDTVTETMVDTQVTEAANEDVQPTEEENTSNE